MVKVCAAGPVTKGMDVSHWQKPLDWHAQKSAGFEFAFVKATEGLSTDQSFKTHIIAAKTAGLIVGAYHFFHPSHDAAAQAHYFANVAGQYVGGGDMPLVIDWETTDGMPHISDREAGLLFLNTVKELTGKMPIVYTGPYFAQALALDSRFQHFPLWIAHYGVVCPLVPHPWTNWQFWQPGQSHGVDYNLFNGTFEQLKAL